MTKRRRKRLPIVIISGGSSRTGEQVLAAALAQFDDPQVKIIRKSNVRSIQKVQQIVQQAANAGAIVCHTLVAPEVRQAVNEQLLRLGVPTVDPLGPVISLLADHLAEVPLGRHGLLQERCKEQFNRFDVVDFTLAHDDGQRLHDLPQADVVLVGVSRVSKSVTCFYLAARGVRAANVPMTTVQDLPLELLRIDPRRVIGLTMNASQLTSLRQARLERMGSGVIESYTDQRVVAVELNSATAAMQRHGWRYIDVSYKAVEDVASEIVELLSAQKERSRLSNEATK